jgi:hypothetical protein
MLSAATIIANSYADLLDAAREEMALIREGVRVDDESLLMINQDIEYQMGRIQDFGRSLVQLAESSRVQPSSGRPGSVPINPIRPESPKIPVVKPGTLHHSSGSSSSKLVFVADEAPRSPPRSARSPVRSPVRSPRSVLVRFHLPDGTVEERVLDQQEPLSKYVEQFSRAVSERLLIRRSDAGPYQMMSGKVSDVTSVGADQTNVWLESRLSRMRSQF